MSDSMRERPILKFVGPNAPTVENAGGGKQSATAYRADLFPPLAFLHEAEILDHGEKKYGENNWRKIPLTDHINHAMIHLFAFLAGDKSDDHLGHATCRLLMALEIQLRGGPDDADVPANPNEWHPHTL